MKETEIKEITLIGLALESKTTNENRQSESDCGRLWQRFENGNYFDKIREKITDEIFAVYYNYEGDYTKPFSYFIGCSVPKDAEIPENMDTIKISVGSYLKFTAAGKMPDCVANKWKEIWNANLPRAYREDFEIYDKRSKDWQNAEVDIYISI